MTVTTPLHNNFASGEISPLLRSRVDFQRTQTALATCLGYVPLRSGAFTRAPGTSYDGTTLGDAAGRLIGFRFAINDAVVLEFTPLKMRVWRYGVLVLDGADPYELTTPFTAEALPLLDWVQSADVIYLASGGLLPVQKLSRLALDSWTIAPVAFRNGPFRVQNLDETLTVAPSGTSGTVTLTASAALFTADHVDTLMLIEPTDYSTVPLWTSSTTVAVGDVMRNDGNAYELTVGTATGNSPPVHKEGTQLVQKSPDIGWKFLDDGQGIVRITAVASATSATATVVKTIPQACVDDPSYRWSEAAWSDRYGWPAALALYEQRLALANSGAEPRTIWFSVVGDPEDFTPSVDADGAFAYTISGQNGLNPIQSLIRGRRALHILGLGEEQSTRSSAQQQAIGPTTAVFGLDGATGAAAARPIAVGGDPVFISVDGRRLFLIAYSFQDDANQELELSSIARHIGAAGFAELAWQAAPDGLIWVRRGDGTLAYLLYDRGQDILGWARVPLAGGIVEAMAVTPSADASRDELTLIVRRTLNGVERRCVERLSPIFATLPGDVPLSHAQHAYCASVFDVETPTDSFSLPHLAAETVHCWTDKGGFGPLTVAGDGGLTLPDTVSHAAIGLYDATHQAETLDLQAAAPEGSAMGRRKRLHANSVIGLLRTAQGHVASVERTLGQAPRVGGAAKLVPLPVAADLTTDYSGFVRVPAPSGNAEEIAMRFTPEGLAPMTVTVLVPTIEEQGR